MKKTTKKPDGSRILENMRKTVKMFGMALPNILAVVLLSGLFFEFVSVNKVSAFFGGNVLTDGLVGALLGSVSIGNPLISYVLGGELLDQGMSLVAVTALLVSWVTVGSVQLPAEMQTFGVRFALVRNALSFLFALIIAVLILITLRAVGAS